MQTLNSGNPFFPLTPKILFTIQHKHNATYDQYDHEEYDEYIVHTDHLTDERLWLVIKGRYSFVKRTLAPMENGTFMWSFIDKEMRVPQEVKDKIDRSFRMKAFW